MDLTRCSIFLLLTGGCSCNTESASTANVASTSLRTFCMGDMSCSLQVARAVSHNSDQTIWDESTTSWACQKKLVKLFYSYLKVAILFIEINCYLWGNYQSAKVNQTGTCL